MGLWAHRRRHHSRSGWYSMSWVWRARPRPTAAGALPGPTLVEDVEVRMTASNFHLQLWPADAGVEAHGYARERPGPHFDVKLSSPRCRAALRVLRPEHVGTRFERHPKPTFRVALSLSHDLPRARSHDRDPRNQRASLQQRRSRQRARGFAYTLDGPHHQRVPRTARSRTAMGPWSHPGSHTSASECMQLKEYDPVGQVVALFIGEWAGTSSHRVPARSHPHRMRGSTLPLVGLYSSLHDRPIA